jgi:hypothetical protein
MPDRAGSEASCLRQLAPYARTPQHAHKIHTPLKRMSIYHADTTALTNHSATWKFYLQPLPACQQSPREAHPPMLRRSSSLRPAALMPMGTCLRACEKSQESAGWPKFEPAASAQRKREFMSTKHTALTYTWHGSPPSRGRRRGTAKEIGCPDLCPRYLTPECAESVWHPSAVPCASHSSSWPETCNSHVCR